MSRFKLFRSAVCAALCLLGIGNIGVALAVPITFEFSGTVTNIYSNPASTIFNSTFDTTQTLTGSYTFESMTSDSDVGDPFRGYYSQALTGLSFSIGSYSGQLGTGGNAISVRRTTFDSYNVDADGPGLGPSVDGLETLTLNLRMINVTAPVFSTFDLPFLPPDLNMFDFADWHITFIDRSSGAISQPFGTVAGVFTSLTLVAAPVPEPATLALMALGLAGIGRNLRRREAY